MDKIITTTIGSYLFLRLRELGVKQIFGVPGDYNLQLIEQVLSSDDMRWLNICNELNAGYAADGYARMNGIGAVLTTYGVGDLSVLNAAAGAWAEHVPLVFLSGAPPVHAITHGLPVHHTAGDGNFVNVINCFREFTALQVCLTYANAVEEIDRALRCCWRDKRPVYLQIPSDIACLEVNVRLSPLLTPTANSDSRALKQAVEFVAEKLSHARRPAFLVGMDVARYPFKAAIQALSERLNIPIYSLSSGKCVVDETHCNYCGVYNGLASTQRVREGVENADLLMTFSPRFIEGNSALYTHNLPAETLFINPIDLQFKSQCFTGISSQELMASLLDRLQIVAEQATPRVGSPREEINVYHSSTAKLTQRALWQRISTFIQENDVVFAENGTANIALSDVSMPAGVSFVSQPVWGSIGYTLPALLGSMLHDAGRRHLLFIGDGSFQLTAQEVSTLLAQGLKPIIFLLNNRGYTIERYILGPEAEYNDVVEWRYTELVNCFSQTAQASTFIVETEGQLEEALQRTQHQEQLVFIQVNLDPMDAPEKLPVFGRKTAEFDYGPFGPQNQVTSPSPDRISQR